MAKKTPLDRLDAAITAILDEYGTDVFGAVKEAVEAATKAGVRAVKGQAQQALDVSGKIEYVKGWTSRIETGRTSRQGIIYNKNVPGLPHLLEYGHVTRNGTGRTFRDTPAHPHIAVVEERIAKEFYTEVKQEVQRV